MAWPNPTTEKIWFVNDKIEQNINQKNEDENKNVDINEITSDHVDKMEDKDHNSFLEKKILDTFNVTHDYTNGFQLKFDDTNWCQSLSMFKPLGLSILLNTCNKQISNNYLNFCDFIRTQSTKITKKMNDKSHYCLTNWDTVNNEISLSSSLNMLEDTYDIKAVMDRQYKIFFFILK